MLVHESSVWPVVSGEDNWVTAAGADTGRAGSN